MLIRGERLRRATYRWRLASAIAAIGFVMAVAAGANSGTQQAGARGYLGFQMRSAGDSIRVTEVAPSGPGARAGLRAGDSLVAFNGVSFRFSSDLEMVRGLSWIRSGVPVELTVSRGGRDVKLLVMPVAFSASDLAALEDWIGRAEQTEQMQREACALETFKGMAAHPGIDVTFTKAQTGDGFTMESKRQLPPELDLSDPFLKRVVSNLRAGDSATIHYVMKSGVLNMDVISSPQYLDLRRIVGQLPTTARPN